MKLTDALKSKIVLEVAEGSAKTEIAKKYNISRMSIERILNEPEYAEMLQNVTQKKEEIAADIEEHMNKCRGKVLTLIDKYLDALLDDERIDGATLSQLTTALGTVIDKWTTVGVRGTETPLNIRIAPTLPPEQPPDDIEEESDE